MRTLVLTTAIAATLSVAAPGAPEKLGDYIERETQGITRTLEENDTGTAPGAERWFFRRFTFRVRPRVVFTAGIAKIGLVPDIELLLDRRLPEGWVPYQP